MRKEYDFHLPENFVKKSKRKRLLKRGIALL